MHEAAAVRVVNLYNGNLVFGGHQQAVLMVEHGRQVHAPAHTSKVPLLALSFLLEDLKRGSSYIVGVLTSSASKGMMGKPIMKLFHVPASMHPVGHHTHTHTLAIRD